MKFRAFIESGTRELEVDFDIDDEVAAHARLTEALAKIQKVVKRPERAASKPAEPVRSGTTSPPVPGGMK
jgi:hypothetical protein